MTRRYKLIITTHVVVEADSPEEAAAAYDDGDGDEVLQDIESVEEIADAE